MLALLTVSVQTQAVRYQPLKRETKLQVWEQKRPIIGPRHWFGTETKVYREYPKKWWPTAKERSETEAVKLHSFNGKTWWRYNGETYFESEGLEPPDVTALALQLQRAKARTLERAHAEMRGEEAAVHPREPIPESVRHEVWRRDGGQCVDCGSRDKLEFDHIIPWSEGGSNTARNLELRCELCNRKKGARI